MVVIPVNKNIMKKEWIICCFNNQSDVGTISIGSGGDTSIIYNKLLRPGFVGLDRNIYEIYKYGC